MAVQSVRLDRSYFTLGFPVRNKLPFKA